MAKKPVKSKKPSVPVQPEHSTYTLKKMDRSMWSAFTAKCAKDGREVKWVMLKMITQYANGDIRIEA